MSDAIEISPKSAQIVEKGSSLQEVIETKVIDITINAADSITTEVGSMENDMKLDEKEERVLSLVEEKARSAASICFSSDLPPVMKITKLVAELMKIMENVRLNGTTIKGAIKKKVAMELIHRLLKELVKDRDTLFEMLTLYHSMAEHLLETMAEVSSALHTAEKITSCCTIF
jgi:Mg2+ and Co2+ transporter CorA